jgi:hypothetical protein
MLFLSLNQMLVVLCTSSKQILLRPTILVDQKQVGHHVDK